jgi:hypothetical protein
MPDIAQASASLVSQSGLRLCFDIRTREPRGIRGLVPRNITGTSGFSTGRYHARREKTGSVKAWKACKCRQDMNASLFSKFVNEDRPVSKSAQERVSQRRRDPQRRLN